MNQKEIRELRSEIKRLEALLKRRDDPNPISRLAPKGGFPELPEIDGVEFAAAAAAVHYKNRDDVMLARIAPGSTLAGVFSRSAMRSAPVLDCESKIAELQSNEPDNDGFAILANSGNSNAFTGASGVDAVEKLTGLVSRTLGISRRRVFSASTGVIGVPLPSERIAAVVESLCKRLRSDGFEEAACAIMTNDTFPKGIGASVEIGGSTIRIAGFAKGSVMIAPDMATMLAFIFTDASVEQRTLQSIVSKAAALTFNSITVDSDTSTSDSVFVSATNRSGAPRIEDEKSKDGKLFSDALTRVMEGLAKQIVRDGVGATKLAEVRVTGADSDKDAAMVAKSIANSPLVKTAIHGEDPNWGRIVMAIGKAGAKADRDRILISFGDHIVAESGFVSPSYEEETAAQYMRNEEIVIKVDLGIGNGSAKVWTCDFSDRYVSINADYSS